MNIVEKSTMDKRLSNLLSESEVGAKNMKKIKIFAQYIMKHIENNSSHCFSKCYPEFSSIIYDIVNVVMKFNVTIEKLGCMLESNLQCEFVNDLVSQLYEFESHNTPNDEFEIQNCDISFKTIPITRDENNCVQTNFGECYMPDDLVPKNKSVNEVEYISEDSRFYDQNSEHNDDKVIEQIKILDIPSQKMFSANESFNGTVVYIENPSSIYVVPSEFSGIYLNLIVDLNNYYTKGTEHSKEIKYNSVEELINSNISYFAIEDENNIWNRGLLLDEVSEKDNHVKVKCIDIGKILDVDISKIVPLNETFMKNFPMAYKCQLDFIKPLGNNGYWEDACLEYIQFLFLKQCSIIINDILDSILIVLVIYEGRTINEEMIRKKIANFLNPYESKSLENHLFEDDNLDNNIKELENDENYWADVDIQFEACNKRDEKLICKNYKGPPDITCFKGNRCKKLHTVFNKDDYTQEKVLLHVIEHLDVSPYISSVINVLVTSVVDFKTIYVQFIEATKIPDSENEEFGLISKMHVDFKNMMQHMNISTVISSMKPLVHYPSQGEMLIAKCESNNMWCRASLISASEYEAEVFFIDYGISEKTNFKNVKQIDDRFIDIPRQAIHCIVSNIKPAHLCEGKKAKDVLCQYILNQVIKIKIICEEMGHSEIILMDTDKLEIGDILT